MKFIIICCIFLYIYMLLDLQKPTLMSHLQLVNCILLAQLIATLVHYSCTVVLMGLVDWSAFLELVFQPCNVTTETMGPMEGTRWEVWVWYSPLCWQDVSECPPGLSGPITSSSCTHRYSKQSHWKVKPASGFSPPTIDSTSPARLPTPLYV